MLSVCPICGSLLLLSFQDISSAIVKTWYTQKGGRTTTVLQPWILVSPQATHHPNFGTGAQLDQAVFPLVPSAVCRASILVCLPPPGTSPAMPGWSQAGAMLANNWLQMCSNVRKWHRALAPPAWGRATRRLACHCTAAASIARRLAAAAPAASTAAAAVAIAAAAAAATRTPPTWLRCHAVLFLCLFSHCIFAVGAPHT